MRPDVGGGLLTGGPAVAGLPMQALDRGAHLIIVNNTPTYLNVRADVVLMQDVSTILPEIAKRVIHG
jgi:NAD-dependent SIR2 family protein deacetylase